MSIETLSMEQPRTRPRADKHVKDPERYKTVLCNKFETAGKCPYGPRCQFAHGAHELRERKAKKEAEMCEPCASEPAVAAPSLPPVLEVPGTPPLKPTAPETHQTPPPSPRLMRLSLGPMARRPLEDITSSDSGSEVPRVPMLRSSMSEASDMPLGVDKKTGAVICRREPSITTQNVRRQISLLFDDEDTADSGTGVTGGDPFSATNSMWGGPFGFQVLADSNDQPPRSVDLMVG